MQLELHWYTDQLGKLEDLVSQEITEWVWLHSCGRIHFAFILQIELTRLKLLLDSSV